VLLKKTNLITVAETLSSDEDLDDYDLEEDVTDKQDTDLQQYDYNIDENEVHDENSSSNEDN